MKRGIFHIDLKNEEQAAPLKYVLIQNFVMNCINGLFIIHSESFFLMNQHTILIKYAYNIRVGKVDW